MHDKGVGGRHLAMSLKASATYLRATACLALTTDQQGTEWKPQLHTTIHHWAGLNVTTLPVLDTCMDNPCMSFSQTTLTIRTD